MIVAEKGTPSRAQVSSCLLFRNELSKDLEFLTLADKAETLLGRAPGWRGAAGKGTWEDCSAMWLTVLALW